MMKKLTTLILMALIGLSVWGQQSEYEAVRFKLKSTTSDSHLYSVSNNGTYHLIGIYPGWDKDGIYIAGYNNDNSSSTRTKKIYFGHATMYDLTKRYFGIGTTTPASHLDILGSGSSGVKAKIHVSDANKGGKGGYFDINMGKGNSYAAGMRAYVPSGQPGIDRVFLGFYTTTFTNSLQSRVERLTITDRGNVGIGTDTPSDKLTVNGSFKVFSGENYFSYNGGADVRLRYKARGTGGRALVHYEGNQLILNFAGDFSGGTRIMGNTVRVDGNVGIGTSTPDYKLDVAGTIRATEIKVEANGQTADFVFQEDYQLRDLQEVESFIQTNKHLPDIPSAAAMEENGVNLAEMNKLLLQKIEELTLYTIEMEKARSKESTVREKLETEVKELKKAHKNTVETLEQRLAKIEALLISK